MDTRRATKLVKDLDIDDLYDQLDTLSDYVQELSASLSKSASRQFGRARKFAAGATHDAEEAMKDNLAASLILAIGLGVVFGYFICRRTE
jgi:F0F1-type ATP synthase assembly protein I